MNRFMYDIAFGFLPRKFKKGQIIYSEGEDVEEFYLIRQGFVLAITKPR
jgi:hypothetical protein